MSNRNLKRLIAFLMAVALVAALMSCWTPLIVAVSLVGLMVAVAVCAYRDVFAQDQPRWQSSEFRQRQRSRAQQFPLVPSYPDSLAPVSKHTAHKMNSMVRRYKRHAPAWVRRFGPANRQSPYFARDQSVACI